MFFMVVIRCGLRGATWLAGTKRYLNLPFYYYLSKCLMLLRCVSFLSIDRLMEVAPVRLPLPRSRPILPRAGPISVAVARTSGSSRLRSRTCGRRLTAGIDVVVVDGAASADLAPVQITWQIAVGALGIGVLPIPLSVSVFICPLRYPNVWFVFPTIQLESRPLWSRGSSSARG